MKTDYKVVIVGGGASGLMCAVELLRVKNCISGKDLLILEKNDRVGKKIVATGNGQGNLCNVNVNENCYHGDKAFIKTYLEHLERINIQEYLKGLGVYLTTDKDGKQYPLSKQANSFLDILRYNLAGKGCEIQTGEKVIKASKKGDIFIVETDKGKYTTQNLVLAFGGKAGKQFGTDGSSYFLAESFGHKTTKLFPSLVQLKTDLTQIRGLKGLKERARLTAYDGEKELKQTVGEILFTDYGVSGNAVFSLSGYLTDAKNPKIKVEFLPDLNIEQISRILLDRKSNCFIPPEDALLGLINKKIGQAILKSSKAKTIEQIAKALKNFYIKVTGDTGFNNAQVTRGGVDTISIDSLSMQSKLCKGLYILGEALNVDGDCGGYNLTFAFVSGIVCAENLVKTISG